MKDSKKLDVFKEALKKAKEGDLFNFDKWLEDNGINPRAFNLKFFQNHFRANPDKMIGNEDIIQKVAEYIGHFLKNKKGLYHIPIIGTNGSGKTLLLNILERFTSDYETNLGSRIDVVQDSRYLLQDIDPKQITRSPDRVRIYFIDNCEKVDNIIKILENVLKLRGDSVYITSWTPESWIRYKEEIKNILPISEEIIIHPLKEGEFGNYHWFLAGSMNSIMLPERMKPEDGYPCPDFIDYLYYSDSLSIIFYRYTWGIPKISIHLLINCIKKTFLSTNKILNEEIIQDVVNEMGLNDLDTRINTLSKLHLRILLSILSEKEERGIRPMQLVKEFDLDKSTISYHLNTLKELGLVEDEKIGKSKYYKIKENLIPFIQLKILNKLYIKGIDDNSFKVFMKKWREKNIP